MCQCIRWPLSRSCSASPQALTTTATPQPASLAPPPQSHPLHCSPHKSDQLLATPTTRPCSGGGGRGCYRVVWLHHRTWGTPPDVLRQQRNSDNGRHSGIALTQEHTANTECCKSEVALCHNPFPFLAMVYCTLSQTYSCFHVDSMYTN